MQPAYEVSDMRLSVSRNERWIIVAPSVTHEAEAWLRSRTSLRICVRGIFVGKLAGKSRAVNPSAYVSAEAAASVAALWTGTSCWFRTSLLPLDIVDNDADRCNDVRDNGGHDQ